MFSSGVSASPRRLDELNFKNNSNWGVVLVKRVIFSPNYFFPSQRWKLHSCDIYFQILHIVVSKISLHCILRTCKHFLTVFKMEFTIIVHFKFNIFQNLNHIFEWKNPLFKSSQKFKRSNLTQSRVKYNAINSTVRVFKCSLDITNKVQLQYSIQLNDFICISNVSNQYFPSFCTNSPL